jgi:hypothetical protein
MIRSTRFWLLAFVVLGVVGYGLSALFGVPGSNNDPLVAEVGNGGMLLAVLGVLVVAVVHAVRSLRGREPRAAMRGHRLLTERRRAWGLLVAALFIVASFGLETHNWSGVPEAITYGLLAVGVFGLLGLLLAKPTG